MISKSDGSGKYRHFDGIFHYCPVSELTESALTNFFKKLENTVSFTSRIFNRAFLNNVKECSTTVRRTWQ